MKREIKFRAWEDRRMIDWEYLQGLFDHYEPEGGSYFMFLVNSPSSKLMQYTGLKDKNGVEIYEGDIVKNHVYVNPIIVGFGNENKLGFYYSYDFAKNAYGDNQWEVIGNIHQNPELL